MAAVKRTIDRAHYENYSIKIYYKYDYNKTATTIKAIKHAHPLAHSINFNEMILYEYLNLKI